jgi:uncharacterized membrane protein YdbT with pleckstrin-like domain
MYNSKNLPLSSRKIIKGYFEGKSGIVGASLLVLILSLALYIFIPETEQAIKIPLLMFLSLIITMNIGFFVYEILYYLFFFYNFGERNIEIREGVISRRTNIIHYEKIHNIFIDQDILDRVLGIYNVHFETTGDSPAIFTRIGGLSHSNADRLVVFLKSKVDEYSIPTLIRQFK